MTLTLKTMPVQLQGSLLCALPCWRRWQNCQFCLICQIRQLVGPPHCLVLCLVGECGKIVIFAIYLPNSPHSTTCMGPLIALCLALLANVAKLSFSPYSPSSPTFSHFCYFCCCVHFWTYLGLSGESLNVFA